MLKLISKHVNLYVALLTTFLLIPQTKHTTQCQNQPMGIHLLLRSSADVWWEFQAK